MTVAENLERISIAMERVPPAKRSNPIWRDMEWLRDQLRAALLREDDARRLAALEAGDS